MNILPDCHLHSCHSSDSDCSPKDIIQTAIKLGLPAICFTDHNDFLFPPENGVTQFQLDFNTYYKDIAAMREQYQDYPIYIGIEQGLLPAAADMINAYDSTHLLDFIIGSSHLVYGQDPYYPKFWEDKNLSSGVPYIFVEGRRLGFVLLVRHIHPESYLPDREPGKTVCQIAPQ